MRVYVRAARVRRWLATRNLSQNDLARRVGTSSGYLAQLLGRSRCPSPRTRARLMRVMGVRRWDELFRFG